MPRRTQSMPPAPPPGYLVEKMPKTRGRCVSAICVSWKVFTCIFSHVLLVTTVVAYCLLGANTFEYLEKTNEIEVKKSISFIRGNLTDGIWKLTYSQAVLFEQNWTLAVQSKLQAFETDILNSMRIRGWDGNEDTEKLQWTFMGALFYSIIVITTIGYGHIAPKTFMGKISTIFYAILGIPLMLLCLSNIGDIMASSFRFIYWRVCCFVCTREPRRPASRRPRRIGGPPPQFSAAYDPSSGGGGDALSVYHHHNQQPVNQRHSAKSNPNPSVRRSIRHSQRTTDSGLGNSYHEAATGSASGHLQHAHSDTELRYSDQRTWDRTANSKTLPNKHQRVGRPAAPAATHHRDRHTVERDRHVAQRPPSQRHPLEVESTAQPLAISRRRSTIRGGNDRYGRSQSMAPESSKAAIGNRHAYAGAERNTMTLPASYGRQNRQNKTAARGPVVVRAQSLDPRDRSNFGRTAAAQAMPSMFNDDSDCKAPVLCNKYAIDDLDNGHQQRRSRAAQQQNDKQQQRCQSMPRQPTGRFGQHPHSPQQQQQQQHQQHQSPRAMDRNRYLDVSMPHPNEDLYHHNHRQQQQQQQQRNAPYRSDGVTNYRQPANHRHQQHHQHQQPHLMYHRHADHIDDVDLEGGGGAGNGCGVGGGGDDLINEDDIFEMHPIRKHHRRRERQAPPPPSPRIMTPMGFAIHRQARLQSSAYAFADDCDSQYGDDWDWDASDPHSARVRPVPIWLCVFLVVSYIIFGAFLFSSWEGWSFLDSAYFCFITLTTIGFGDFVPAQGVKENPEMSIAFCSLYLLFGIALLAMSFNLVQEEVIANVKNVARQLGILKEEPGYY